ncbi:LamG-like jellyroll fold domain-containing protein [Bacteroides sp.]|uniref:LamG-like jellyroll fold domain-containing protein n=1 Tax=Bacteroides sp. TaxID=29523 RepID=UPI0025BFF808|nr:LamG-like jellyroll fold domain-containing protein [Bacteroides sp.]
MLYKKLITTLLLPLCMGTMYAQQLAFPGAEGYGRFAQGARASETPEVYHVTNLDDSGKGSLRDAVSQPNRIVIFDVSGVIKLKSRLVFSKNLTIAGQTAPGEGVVVYGNGVSFSAADNIIVRYLRIRMGIGGTSGADAAGIANGGNMIFDHISATWGLDENFSINWDSKGFEPYNITIQNSIIGQGIMVHACGGLIQTNGGVTLYRNLYIDNKTRNPKAKGLNQFVNNVVYNWGEGGAYILGDTEASSWGVITNNYFIKGPVQGTKAFTRAKTAFQVYQKGNMIDYNQDGILNGYEATEEDYRRDASNPESENVTFVDSYDSFDYSDYDRRRLVNGEKVVITTEPEKHPVIAGETNAVEAFNWIVDKVGASLPERDEADNYMIDELLSLGTKGALLSGESELGLVNGVGNIFAGNRLLDTDNDGIPDVWEDANGLDKNNPNDAVLKAENGYLNIENYINSITGPIPYVKYPTNLQLTSLGTDYLSFKWVNNASDATLVVLEYSTDNEEFTEIALEPGTATYKLESLIPNTTYYIRLKTVVGEMESLYTSVQEFATRGVPAPPVTSVDPIPENEATISDYTSVRLSWENKTGAWAGALSHTVYLGKSKENMDVVLNASTASVVTVNVEPATTYYWRVDTKNLMGECKGDVWSFTTGTKPERGKVAYYSFNETEGTVLENAYGEDATAKDFTPSWVEGIRNNAVQFNMANAAFVQEHYDALTLGSESFSIELWFKSAGGSVDWYLIHKGSHATTSYEGATGKWFGIQYQKNSKNDRLTWAIDDNVTKTDVNATGATAKFFTNEWVHLVCVRDVEDKQLKMYANGVLIVSGADKTGDIGTIEKMAIGNCNTAYENGFQGLMDELTIYNEALTSEEIKDHYKQGTATHINNITAGEAGRAYPMPFVNEFYIPVTDADNASGLVTIMNTAGRTIYQTKVAIDGGVARVMDVGSLSEGYYIYTLKLGHKVLIGKIVK